MNKNIIILATLIFALSSTACYAEQSKIDTKLPLAGGTLCNLKLQADTLIPAYVAASVKKQNCKNLKITNTRVTKQPYNLKYQNGNAIGGNWEEVRTVNACNQNVYVPIKFILDPTGATYVIEQDKVK